MMHGGGLLRHLLLLGVVRVRTTSGPVALTLPSSIVVLLPASTDAPIVLCKHGGHLEQERHDILEALVFAREDLLPLELPVVLLVPGLQISILPALLRLPLVDIVPLAIEDALLGRSVQEDLHGLCLCESHNGYLAFALDADVLNF